MELYRKHRPKTILEVIGQSKVVNTLRKLKEMPHAYLLSGPSGSGKTTVAHMIRKKLKCHDNDFVEFNSANFRGIDTVRQMMARAKMKPSSGRSAVWMLDEAHQFTPQAQEAMLKLLEDPADHCYYMLVTTDPQKLKATLRSRCLKLQFEALSNDDIYEVLHRALPDQLSGEVLGLIAEHCQGNAREALMMAESVVSLPNDEQADSIQSPEQQAATIDLCRALFNGRGALGFAGKITDDPERVRWAVLGYAKSVMLNPRGDHAKAAKVIKAFKDNFYDSKQAGLVLAVYNAVRGE